MILTLTTTLTTILAILTPLLPLILTIGFWFHVKKINNNEDRITKNQLEIMFLKSQLRKLDEEKYEKFKKEYYGK